MTPGLQIDVMSDWVVPANTSWCDEWMFTLHCTLPRIAGRSPNLIKKRTHTLIYCPYLSFYGRLCEYSQWFAGIG